MAAFPADTQVDGHSLRRWHESSGDGSERRYGFVVPVASVLREGYEVTALSFDYGQKHVVELERASQLIDYLGQHGHKVHHHVADLRSATALFQSHLLSGGEEVPRGHYEEENMKATVVPRDPGRGA